MVTQVLKDSVRAALAAYPFQGVAHRARYRRYKRLPSAGDKYRHHVDRNRVLRIALDLLVDGLAHVLKSRCYRITE